MAIFSQKPMFVCNSYLGSSKQSWDSRCHCKKLFWSLRPNKYVIIVTLIPVHLRIFYENNIFKISNGFWLGKDETNGLWPKILISVDLLPWIPVDYAWKSRIFLVHYQVQKQPNLKFSLWILNCIENFWSLFRGLA
jgi:hypothetical protein